MTAFDLSTCPLSGINLIEASAGTGKTYALAGLFLRLMVEKQLPANRLLVITFTQAATAELKTRIRKMIAEAQTVFLSGHSENTLMTELLAKYPDACERKRIIRQLGDALANFDETAIYTIHGFCQRILSDNAFASGFMFETEMLADQNNLEKEFAFDFWRKHFYDNHPVVVQYALEKKLNPQRLIDLLHLILSRPVTKIIPDHEPFSRALFEEALNELILNYSQLKTLWFDQKESIADLLRDKALSGQVYGKKTDSLIRKAEEALRHPYAPLPMPASIVKLSVDALRNKTNKNQTTPSHAVFDLCQMLCGQAEKLTALLDRYLSGLKKEFLESARTDFPGLKKKKNILYFDDLLTRAYQALDAPGGTRLAEILQNQYPAVLVDEFQDTDPVQYAILQAIFLRTPEKPESAVFYIGDPKQAIYSFRGADIYAYLRAAKTVDRKYTMEYNWRSEASLVNAVNVLFEKHPNAFVYDDIPYTRVKKAPDKKVRPLKIEGEDAAGLHGWFVSGQDDGNPLGVAVARKVITRAVISEISRLLNKGQNKAAFLGDQPLAAGDIAILVRKNSEGITFKNALSRAGIASVIYSAQSVFASEESQDLRLLMLGILHHENEGRLLAALTTPFFAYSKNEIAACLEQDDQLEDLRMQFKALHDLWQEKGFLNMFMRQLEREDIRVKIVSLPDGERRLTNYFHLAELLFEEERRGHLQPSDLLSRFEEMILAGDHATDDQQQRLETDRHGIRIITIHKSKGLEYPIVFCPFVWESGFGQQDSLPVCFHEKQNEWQAIADLGSDRLHEHQEQSAIETLAEECRLLYVSLTRAANRCYFVWGNIKGAQTGAAGYLFNPDARNQTVLAASDQELFGQMTALAALASDDIQVAKLDLEPAVLTVLRGEVEPKIHYHEFRGSIDSRWKIASYTFLAKSDFDDTEWDEDTHDLFHADAGAETKPGDRLLSFPPGAVSGNLLHDVLEKIDFTRIGDDQAQSIIDEALDKFNYSGQWRQAILNMLSELVKTRLTPYGPDAFSLSEITPLHCRKEMEFYFPLKDISPAKLMPLFSSVLHTEGRQQRKLHFPQVQGFLKGFIDLVFEYRGRYYLADWKSNDLGNRYEHYRPELLKQEMMKSFYDMQYLIYTIALHQYLKKRLPGYSYQEHFGGVYYFFLRGVQHAAGKENGIYYDRPEEKLILELGTTFLNI